MISVIVPAYNEEDGVIQSLRNLDAALASFSEYEIIVINDGSTDSTPERILETGVERLVVITHPENMGYGKSLIDGIAVARNECICIIDADGSYPASQISELYRFFPAYDMVVGARQGWEYKKGIFKGPARMIFQMLSEYAAGRSVPDINSGLRIFKRSVVLKFQDSLCAGFSFTTTITLHFMLNHYFVKYIPVTYNKRDGVSKIRHFRDTLRAFQYIVEAILYYNPIKLFLLLASMNLIAGGILAAVNLATVQLPFLDILSAILVASFMPIFGLGLIAAQLRKIYGSSQRWSPK